MKLHYSILVLSLASIVIECSDNNNNNNQSKQLPIIEAFKALIKKDKLTKAQKIERKKIKTELNSLSTQDYASAFHGQIQDALDNDKHKTPIASPVVIKTAPSIKKELENKENVHFGSVNTVDFYKHEEPISVALDVLTNDINRMSISKHQESKQKKVNTRTKTNSSK